MAKERNIDDILGDNVGKFRDRVQDNVDKFRDRVEENVDKIRDQVDDVRDRLEDAADKAWSKSEEAWKDAAKFTQKHPAQALGLALVLGAAAGVLLFGRRKE